MTSKTNNAKASNVVSINPKGDKATADVAHKAERLAILGAIDTASDLLASGLIAGLKMTAQYGLTSKAEVAEGWTRCNSPDVYASDFNRGYKAMAIIGEKLTLELIDKAEAATGKGGGYVRAKAALKAVIDGAKAAGVKELSGKAATTAVREAVAACAKPKAEKSATRAPQGQTDGTLAKAALAMGKGHAEMAAFLLAASRAAQSFPCPEGRETAHKDALDALADAAEAFAVFAPPAKRLVKAG